MPTIDQLAPATAASDADELLVSQSGIARKITRAQALAGLQPQLAIGSGSLLGRSSAGTGEPEQVSIGANLSLTKGVLSASPMPFNVASLTAGLVPAGGDFIALGQGGQNVSVTYSQFMNGLSGISNVDLSQLLVTPTGGTSASKLADIAANILPLTGGTLTGTLTLAADPAAAFQAATKQYVDGQVATALPKSGGILTGPLTLATDPTALLQPTTKQYVDAQVATALPKTGGTLTGLLTLSASPTTALQAAPKQYVDTQITATVLKSGGTMTGALTLAADPASNLQAATKQYVDKRVLRTGDTLTGPLILASDPTTALQAATKGYVDALVAAALPMAGGTLSGPLTLAADPAASLQAATKQYVDKRLLRAGDTLTGPLLLAADPTTPLQAATKGYVDAQLAATAAAALLKSGDTMTGALTLSGDPTAALHAATKQYVDKMLPLAGGSLAGALMVNNSTTVTSTLSAGTGSANYWQFNGASGFTQMWVKGVGNAYAQVVLGGQNSYLQIVNGASGGIATFTDLSNGNAIGNYLAVFNGQSGQPLIIRAAGSDSNKQIQLQPAQNGGVLVSPQGGAIYSGSTWNPQLSLNTSLGGSTMAAGYTNVHQVVINSDILDASGSGIKLVNYSAVNASFGGAAMKGNRQGFDASINLAAPSGNAKGGAYVGLVGAASASSSDNGTGLTPSTVGGAVWGANFYACIGGSVQNFGGVVGIEVNPALGAGTTAGQATGIQVVPTSSHNVQGAYKCDIGYLLASQQGAVGLHYGLMLGAPYAAWPIDPSGTLIYAGEPNSAAQQQARAAWGIDFTGPIFSGGFAKSIGFSVDGSGAIAAKSLNLPGFSATQTGATLTLDASGQQLSSISSVAAAGAGYWLPGDKFTFGTSGIGKVLTVKVITASVSVGGGGGTNGIQIVTGTTGTGTRFQASVTIASGAITAVNSIALAGDYSAYPGTWNTNNHLIESITGAGLTGACLDITLGVSTATQLQPDQTVSLPVNPVPATPSNRWGATGDLFKGQPAGLTLNLSYTKTNALSVMPSGGAIGFYGATPVAKQTGVAVTTAAVHAALCNLGLISA